MKFHYMSDLHLEFGEGKKTIKDIKGENLILAGDITLMFGLNPETNHGHEKIKTRTDKLFDMALKNFDRVFYLTGNHEPYHFDMAYTDRYVKEFLPKEITYLNNTAVELPGDVVVMGGTLWTDMNKGNPTDMYRVEWGMNDFQIIHLNGNVFTPTNALEMHRATMAFFTEQLEKYKDKKVVIATHHSPTYKGINPKHTHSDTNAGYASDLEQYITDHPQIKYWVFGHTHIQAKFDIGSTKVVSNAQGYVATRNRPAEPSVKTFEPDTFFEV